VSVSREQVLAIAALARLHLSEAEAATFAAQLSGILSHAEALAAAQTDDAVSEPTGTGAVRLRPDEPAADPLRRQPDSFAPSWIDGFFAVPRLAAMDPSADDAEA
jgi:aspartyl/glutamyl-tRNA(Asn/Gln) amidotransferase C subunit